MEPPVYVETAKPGSAPAATINTVVDELGAEVECKWIVELRELRATFTRTTATSIMTGVTYG